MLAIKKIYVDSKYKTADSVSDSNFKFQLSQTVSLPDECKFYVSDVSIPHSWQTVNKFNSKLYLRIFYTSGPNVGQPHEDYILDLNQKSYIGTTFATMLKSKIQEKLPSITTIQCTFDSTTNKLSLTINADIEFQFLTDRELIQDTIGANNFAWNGDSYNKNDLKSANNIMSNTSHSSIAHDNTHPFNNHLNLQPIRNLYLHSTNLNSYQSLGCMGEQSIIKKIPVSSNQGEMIFTDYSPGSVEMFDIGKQTLRLLDFRLTNVDGVQVPLNGNHCSFSICFN